MLIDNIHGLDNMTITELIEEGLELKESINGTRKMTKQDEYAIWAEKVRRFLNQTVPGDMVINTFDQEVRAFYPNNCTKEGFGKLIAVLRAYEMLPQKTAFTGATNMSNENNINITNTLSNQQNQNQKQSTPSSIFTEAIKDELRGKELKEIREMLQSKDTKLEEKESLLSKKYKEIGAETMAKILANITLHPEVMPTI